MRTTPPSPLGLPFACLLAVAAVASGSRADDADMAKANRLLEEGRALKQQGKVETGCVKIEESVGVRPGYAAELELADCHAAMGRPARAVQELSSIAARAALRSRADTANLSVYQEYISYADGRIKALAPKLAGLPKVVVTLSDAALATPGLKVKLDGIPIEPLSRTTAVVVDAGHHVVRAGAPGKREATWEGDLTLGEKTAAFESLEDEPPAPAATTAAPTAPTVVPTAAASITASVSALLAAPSVQASSSSSARPGGVTARDVGMIAGLAAGVLGLATGTAFGVAGLSKRTEGASLHCGEAGEPSNCPALRAEYDALVAGEVIGFVGAGLGLGLAMVLFVTRPRGPAASVQLAPLVGAKSAGLGVSGRF